jgi:hypothetical protein
MATLILSAVTAFLGLLAAATAIRQVQLLRRDLAHKYAIERAHVYFQVVSMFRDFQGFFVDHPELRAYFYENRALPADPTELARLDAASEMIVDLAEGVFACGPGLGDTLCQDWNKYFAFLYQSSEALREYWRKNSQYYPPGVHYALLGSSGEGVKGIDQLSTKTKRGLAMV